jgi:TolB-like protein/class 3 adenylate cyclase
MSLVDPHPRRKLAAILAADVVGYSKLMANDEARTLALLKARRRLVLEPLIARHEGRLFKVMGDAVLVEFASAVKAVECSVELQKAMAAANTEAPGDPQIVLRVGISLGDVMIEAGDLYGDGVNIAVRLEAIAQPGGVVISGAAYEQVKNKTGFHFEDLGLRELKNIPDAVHSYSIRSDTSHDVHRFRPGSSKLAGRTSIAVLPFVNLSNDPEQDYFSDGVTEDLIVELSRFRELNVIARASSFAYRGTVLNLERVGAELGSRYVVEGTVRRVGDRLRVSVQLVESATGKHLSAERYDRNSVEIRELQHEVVQKIVARITGRVFHADHDRALQMSADELAAYDCWLRGQHVSRNWSATTDEEALNWFEAALVRDPHFARAHSSLALLLNVKEAMLPGYEEGEMDRDRALKHARLAVQCDNEDARSHYSLGSVSMLRGDFAVAERHYRLTEELNPSAADTILNCAFAAAVFGDLSKAQELAERAFKLNPLHDDWYYSMLSVIHFIAGEYERCFEVGHSYVDFFPELAGWTAAALGLLGREAEARNEGAKFLRITEEIWAGREPFSPRKAVEWFLHINQCLRGSPRDELLRGLSIADLPVP